MHGVLFSLSSSSSAFGRQHRPGFAVPSFKASVYPAAPSSATFASAPNSSWSASRKSHINNIQSPYSSSLPSPLASPIEPSQVQLEHLIRLFKDSMRMYLQARRALDRELAHELSIMTDNDCKFLCVGSYVYVLCLNL